MQNRVADNWGMGEFAVDKLAERYSADEIRVVHAFVLETDDALAAKYCLDKASSNLSKIVHLE